MITLTREGYPFPGLFIFKERVDSAWMITFACTMKRLHSTRQNLQFVHSGGHKNKLAFFRSICYIFPLAVCRSRFIKA